MPIGFPVSLPNINNQLGGLASRWKHLSDNTLEFAPTVIALGTAGLEALTPAFGTTDAANVITAAGYLANLAGAYYGTATITPVTNFDVLLLPLRGTGPG